jgi:hypothetical protein
MPFDPQDGFPDDWHVPPSAQGDGFPDDWHVPASAEGDGFPDDWHVPASAQGDGFPDDWHVPPSAEGDGFPDDWHVPPSAEGDGFPDDWHVPPSAEGGGFPDDWHVPRSAQGDGFPNDWHVPSSAAPGISQGTPVPEPGATASIRGNRTLTPDLQSPFFPPMPASRAGIGAWGGPLANGEFRQFPLRQTWPSALSPLSAGGGPLGSFASPQPATNAPPFAGRSPFGGVTTFPPESGDASPYSAVFGGLLPPKFDTSDTPSPTPVADSQYSAAPLPALDNLDRPPLGSSRLLVSEGGDREEDERRKFETPEVIGGLAEPGLGSPKQPPTLSSIPPLDVPPDGAERSAVTDAWGLPPIRRGRALEPLFGHNLHPNNPTVDIWDRRSGTVTSLKSIDLGSSAYQESNALYNKLSGYVNDLTDFQGSRYGDIFIPGEEIKSRVLTVIVPTQGSPAQQEVMRRIVEFGTQRGVTVNFKIQP